MAAVKEETLLERLRSPATRYAAFEEMVGAYQRMLYYHIRRLVLVHDDADDVLQNTFVKAWRNLDSFRGEAALKTWLYRIATNEALNFLNQKKRRAFTGVEGLEDTLAHSINDSTQFDGDEIQKQLQEAILTLPERQRLVFNLRYYDEMPYDQMAEVTGVTTGSLKASYHHAVKKIETHLKARLTS